jgi:hypothetical protein
MAPVATTSALKTALVLAGGGGLGAVQVGMLRALTESGVKPDLIVGSSVGAINGAYFAGDPTLEGMARLERRSGATSSAATSSLAGAGCSTSFAAAAISLPPTDGLRNLLDRHPAARVRSPDHPARLALPDPALAAAPRLRLRRAIADLTRVVDVFIAAGRARRQPGNDLLSTMIAAQDEDGSQMSDRQLRDEAMTLYLAGHETTALALAWTW